MVFSRAFLFQLPGINSDKVSDTRLNLLLGMSDFKKSNQLSPEDLL